MWHSCRHLRFLAPGVKKLSAKGRLGNQELPLFILGPHHISETNGARKLTFGTLVDICRYYGYMYKFVR